ncbi:hypothetical protein ACJX0J_009838, partial [Zea mays]
QILWCQNLIISRDGRMKLSSQMFFASIDQRSERAHLWLRIESNTTIHKNHVKSTSRMKILVLLFEEFPFFLDDNALYNIHRHLSRDPIEGHHRRTAWKMMSLPTYSAPSAGT